MHADILRTERLELVPGSLEMLRGELVSPAALQAALGVRVPDGWPPDLYDAAAIEYSIRQLESNPAHARWRFYYFVLRDADDGRTAVGVGGYKGEPSEDGTVEVGYSILSDYRRRGLATEAVRAFVDAAFTEPRVRRVIAETLPDLAPSIGVLHKCGMRFAGDGSEAGVVRYEITREEHAPHTQTPGEPTPAPAREPHEATRRGGHVALSDAIASLLNAPGSERAVELFRHGTLKILMYAPQGEDHQTPHSRDEVYVVANGEGLFFDGVERVPFAAGDVLFAPAGVSHRFENFSDGLAVWVLFYGPEGGEANGAARPSAPAGSHGGNH